MPRPIEEESKKPEGCWAKKSTLERVLIVVTPLAIIFMIVLLFLAAKKEVDFALKYCNTTACLSEASKINSYIDPKIKPCDDFYEFVCGNFLKNANGDVRLSLPRVLEDQGIRELFEGYIEPIREDDHKMVKAAKELFRACMYESEIELDNLHTIKEAVKALGGWPVVEGSKWIEGNFDWVTATYKLREIGYHFSVFLDLTVAVDPEDKTRHIFQVATPDMWDYSSIDFDKIEFMTEIAVLFGAQDSKRASGEMAKAHAFLTRLQLEIHNQYGLGAPLKFTVKEYQQKCTILNWHEFINTLTSPAANISEDDHILFPLPETLTSWIDLISKAPKRVQANYMVWKLIESVLPYLPEDVRNRANSHRKREDRKDFCLMGIQEKFVYSPIDIMCDRKYLPKKIRDKAEEIADDIKTELISALEKVEWMNKTNKEEVLVKAKGIKIVVGQPGNYFDDKILDDLDVDMVPTENKTFLNLLAQANRNLQTSVYQQINKLTTENLSGKWRIISGTSLPMYSEEYDILYIPAVSVSNFLFNETRPNYINYGAFGMQVAHQFSGVLNKYLRYEEHESRKCMGESMKNFNLNLDIIIFNHIMRLNIGGQLAYTAYENWVKNHGQEQHLIAIEYSPKQLFWISAVSGYCQPTISHNLAESAFGGPKFFSGVVSGSMRNIPQLAKDFECPEGATMNPSKRCTLL